MYVSIDHTNEQCFKIVLIGFSNSDILRSNPKIYFLAFRFDERHRVVQKVMAGSRPYTLSDLFSSSDLMDDKISILYF